MSSGTGASRGAAVIFDLDGVLIDSEELQYRAYSEVLRPFGAEVTREVYAREWIATGLGPEYAVETFALSITPDELRRRKQPIYHRLLVDEAALMPCAREAVSEISARFPTAVATNSNERDTLHVLERFDLRRRFEAIVTRECYENPKPAPDAFLVAASALKTPRDRCLVVEDAERGVRGAHAAGIPVVAVPHAWTRDHDFRLAERCLESLESLSPELVVEILDAAAAG